MYATIHQFRRTIAEESDGWGAALAADLHGSADPLGSATLAQLNGLDGAVLAFWPKAETAAAAADRRTTSGPLWLDAAAFLVTDQHIGVAGNHPPHYAQLTWFDGPRSQAQADATDRANRDRIWPAVRDVEGVISAYILAGPDRSMVVASFATGVETHDVVRRAILATTLLPGEDPALLTEPDRGDAAAVVHAQLPALASAGDRS